MSIIVLLGAVMAQPSVSAPDPDRKVEEPSKSVELRPEAAQTSFPASFFAELQPQNALDMLSRLPGFTLIEGHAVRGFGGAAGNVLVDGARPASKDISLSEYLRRIPASVVERIELIDGAEAGLQGGASRLIANVVRRTAAPSSGTWRMSNAVTARNRHAPFGAISWNGTLIGLKTMASLEGGLSNVKTVDGVQRNFDGLVQQVEAGPYVDLRRFPSVAGALNLSRDVGGTAAALSLSVRRSRFERVSRFDVVPEGGTKVTRIENESDRNTDRNEEISLELTRRIGRGEAKLIGLHGRRRSNVINTADTDPLDQGPSGGVFEADEWQRESVLRANWAPRWSDFSMDFALEAARTSLRSDTRFSQIDAGVLRPGPEVRTEVAETRGSAEISLNYTGFGALTIEGALAGEISRISLAPPFAASNRYAFFKPRLVANWRPADNWTLNLRLERKVDQLNFSDFVGAVEVQDSNTTETNAELQPPQIDSVRLNIDHRWGRRGNVSLTLVGERISNVVDVVPIGAGGQGIGNLPTASRMGFDLLATLPVPFLFRDAEFTIDASWRQTSVRDPFNGIDRPLQFREYNPAEFGYRHVVSPHFTYGGTLRVTPLSRSFRVRQLSLFDEGPSGALYAELLLGGEIKLRIEANRLFGGRLNRDLIRFDGVRGLTPVFDRELRERRDRPSFAIQLEGRF